MRPEYILTTMAIIALFISSIGVILNIRYVARNRGRSENGYIILKTMVLCYFMLVYSFVLLNIGDFGCAEATRPYFRTGILILLTLMVCDAWIRPSTNNRCR